MLDGVVRFPPEFAARYSAKGYWEDRSLADTFSEVFAKYADRVAIIDRDRHITYAEIDERSTRLALNLLDEGIKPLDRVVMQLPNVVEFVYLYFALQKIGCIPVAINWCLLVKAPRGLNRENASEFECVPADGFGDDLLSAVGMSFKDQ